jgi:beta-RFAP synthase
MFSFGHAAERQFGGVGVMVENPELRLRIEHAATWQFDGQHAERVMAFIHRLNTERGMANSEPCSITVEAAPPQHVGLGVGTQLTLALEAGLAALDGRWPLDAVQLAELTGRAQRSSVGTYGFLHGGMVVDKGRLPDEPIGLLEAHLPLPESWRFVLSYPPNTTGLHGTAERDAFDALPPVPQQVTATLHDLVAEKMLPAVQSAECDAFGEALYQFGVLAGSCFASQQAGSFASPAIAALIEKLRKHGVRGVGQSSWGPTVFSLVPSQEEAVKLVAWLVGEYGTGVFCHHIARPANYPATIQTW